MQSPGNCRKPNTVKCNTAKASGKRATADSIGPRARRADLSRPGPGRILVTSLPDRNGDNLVILGPYGEPRENSSGFVDLMGPVQLALGYALPGVTVGPEE